MGLRWAPDGPAERGPRRGACPAPLPVHRPPAGLQTASVKACGLCPPGTKDSPLVSHLRRQHIQWEKKGNGIKDRGRRATSESAVQTRATSRAPSPPPVRSGSGPHAVAARGPDLGVPIPPPDSARAPHASFLTLYPHTAPLSAGRQPRARAKVDSRADPGNLQLETAPARQG